MLAFNFLSFSHGIVGFIILSIFNTVLPTFHKIIQEHLCSAGLLRCQFWLQPNISNINFHGSLMIVYQFVYEENNTNEPRMKIEKYAFEYTFKTKNLIIFSCTNEIYCLSMNISASSVHQCEEFLVIYFFYFFTFFLIGYFLIH